MFAMPATSGTRPTLPHRTVSLGAQQAVAFNQIEEELRDIRRVHSQGQEEDLRMALSRTIGRVEELVRILLIAMVDCSDHVLDIAAERGVQGSDRSTDRINIGQV